VTLLRWRLLSATVILTVAFVLIWLDYAWNFGYPGIWLTPLLVLCALGGAAETADLLASARHRVSPWPTYVGTVLAALGGVAPLLLSLVGKPIPPGCPVGPLGWPVLALALGAAMALGAEMRRFSKPGKSIVHAGLSIFVMTYVGALLSFLGALRMLGSNSTGITALLSVIVVVKFSDVGAYTFGRLFGRHKLSPTISPGKTVEGAIGGVVAACFAAWVYFQWIAPALFDFSAPRWWTCLVFGVVMTAAGMFGDLAESMFKRDMQRKDSSSWLPGLGGVLDIIDSLLFAAPAGFLCWILDLFA